MITLKDLVDEVILEVKQENLKLFYDIDVFIQEFKDEEEPEEPEVAAEPVAEPAPTAVEPVNTPVATATESVKDTDNLLDEAIIKSKVAGELLVPKEDALNIQTIQDLVDYLSDKKHTKQSIVEKVLDKKGTQQQVNIINPEIQEVILILAGAGGEGAKELGDIVDKGDKVIVDIDYGTNKTTSIGFKINKNAGTEVFSIMLKKDGKILPGSFDSTILNKQILFYRNSLES